MVGEFVVNAKLVLLVVRLKVPEFVAVKLAVDKVNEEELLITPLVKVVKEVDVKFTCLYCPWSDKDSPPV